ncbi:hypothetical protein EGW08_015848 [Elysia chlorotica]|uniref:C-type lectin domain-containing protein n=1 Tax=Elysia chlorotica TaxID=188477 RepID=A0A3S1BB14_ELYCH|nr:hypothetical protein EGW08_015848 [Elysia chlorotica]
MELLEAIFIGLLQALVVSAASLKRQMLFKVVTSSNMGTEQLASAWTVHSLAACGTTCRSRYGSQCQTFMYNSITGRCTPGSFLKYGTLGAALAPSSTDGNLYAPSSCDTSGGFRLVTSGTLSACIMVSDVAMYYLEALEFCLSVGAHLFVGRTMQKINMLPHGIRLYIGLTDLASEGTFIWQDTGDAITPALKKQLFDSGQPDNNNNEDCVSITAGGTNAVGNDALCAERKFRVACERTFLR